MRIFFFTQYFWPENFRINEIVNYFRKSKNKLTVLTGYPSYPHKKIYKNFREKNEIISNSEFKIIRVPIIPRSDSNISIILNYISFIISSFFYGFMAFFKKKFDVIFLFCPSPILSVLPAVFLNKIFKKKMVIWILDLWPNTIIDLKIIKNKYLIKIMKIVVKFIYNNTDLILAQSKSIKEEIEKITSTKCIYFPSWPEEGVSKGDVDFVMDLKNKNKTKTKIIFAGNIGEAQSFETLIEAAKIVKKYHLVEWIILGDGRWKKKLINLIKENDLSDHIKIINAVPSSKVKFYLDQADALYLSLKKNDTFKKTIPGKLSTYMFSEKPIIASISGETSKIINQADCGFASEAENYNALAENVIKFTRLSEEDKKKLGINAKNYVSKYFEKKNILNNLELEIKKIIN